MSHSTNINPISQEQAQELAKALAECVIAAGIIEPGTELTGPQLLMLAGDLKSHLQSARENYCPMPIEPTVDLLVTMSLALGMEPLSDGKDGGYPITGKQSTVRQAYAALIAQAARTVNFDVQMQGHKA
ncbi:hypothetical protein [Stutzerimonas stutzeri]|uniref:hypothetical protein n=1 Tax=Stutzerimonas stutzeri TaxID=316 RepID=UPI001BCD8789|nr:hypothetical protein [Stutzerimonas stutzeri]